VRQRLPHPPGRGIGQGGYLQYPFRSLGAAIEPHDLDCQALRRLHPAVAAHSHTDGIISHGPSPTLGWRQTFVKRPRAVTGQSCTKNCSGGGLRGVLDRRPRTSTRNCGHDAISAHVAGCARSALSPEGTNTSPYLCIEGPRHFVRRGFPLWNTVTAQGPTVSVADLFDTPLFGLAVNLNLAPPEPLVREGTSQL